MRILEPKFWLKGCKRCRGDLWWDDVEEVWSCLQCGREFEKGEKDGEESGIPTGHG